MTAHSSAAWRSRPAPWSRRASTRSCAATCIWPSSVAGQDDLVDEDFTAVKQALIAAIAREPGQGEVALDLLMIAKYFERIGDHAVNLSEWVEFSVTGVHKHDGVEYE